MKALLLDANILVRFLVQDDLKQSAAATTLLAKAERGDVKLYLDAITLAEVIYVLTGRYRRPNSDVVNSLLSTIKNPGIEMFEEDIATDALRRFARFEVDFADAWLAARSAYYDRDVASFDRDFDKFPDITRFDPITG